MKVHPATKKGYLLKNSSIETKMDSKFILSGEATSVSKAKLGEGVRRRSWVRAKGRRVLGTWWNGEVFAKRKWGFEGMVGLGNGVLLMEEKWAPLKTVRGFELVKGMREGDWAIGFWEGSLWTVRWLWRNGEEEERHREWNSIRASFVITVEERRLVVNWDKIIDFLFLF